MKDVEFAEGIYSIMEAAEYVLKQRGDGGWDIGCGVPYKNDVFETFPFQWDYLHEDEEECHCEGECPGEKPNFRHFASGLEVSWYKRVGRSTESNIDMKTLDWYRIVVECLESLKVDLETWKWENYDKSIEGDK